MIEILWLKIGQHFKPDGRSRFGGLSLVKILKLNFDQLLHDMKAVILEKAHGTWVRCAFGNVLTVPPYFQHQNEKKTRTNRSKKFRKI